MTRPRNMHRLRAFGVALVLTAGLGWQARSEGATAVLADCQQACGGFPSNTQCTTACNAAGCPGSWQWTTPENLNTQRCNYTSNFTAGAKGAWIPDGQETVYADACGDSVNDNTVQVNKSIAKQETATVTVTIGGSFSQTVKGEVNTGLVSAGTELQTSVNFSTGVSHSSSVTVTVSKIGTLTAPKCGKKVGYLTAFKSSRASTGTLTFTFEGKCTGCANQNWQTARTCTTNVSLAGSKVGEKWTVCELTCANPHYNCNGSSTHTDNNSCKPNQLP